MPCHGSITRSPFARYDRVMPSPVGHALGAIAAGTVARGGGAVNRPWVAAAILGAIGVAPDLDLLWNRHSQETHSIGAAVIVASLAAWRRWPIASSRGWIFVAAFFAWLSHPLLDALGSDSSVPIGVMAFWPVSTQHVSFGVEWFPSIYRAWWRPGFWQQNAYAVAVEIAILAPAVGLALWQRRRHRS